MNYFIFNTGGDWDSTTLYLNGEEFLANKLYLGLQAGRDENGKPRKGGLQVGGEMTAYAWTQDNREVAIFPGRIDLEFPTHKVVIENHSPMFAIELTQITLDGQDVSDAALDLEVNIDAVENQASAYLSLFKPHFFGRDEIETTALL